MIYVEPESGLCNRMRVIDSAIQLAKYRKTKVKIIWKVNHDVGGEFLDLFEPLSKDTGVVKIVNDYQSGYFDIGYNRNFKGIKKFFKPQLIDLPEYEASEVWNKYKALTFDYSEYDEQFDLEIKNLWNKRWGKDRYYIRLFSRFFGNPKTDYSIFKPKKEILQRCSNILNKYSGNTIGVHIRRTDNIDAINASPTELYLHEMDRALSFQNEVKFFVATDSQEEKDIIFKHFRGKVIYNESKLERNSLAGITDAIIDLVCLSKTNSIIGSACSSFTETAIYYNGLKDFKIIGHG